uniref:Nuclear receptor n=1 Tax=Ascaris lumbricoides TaxID=6252 RepID=A0A0M3HQZ0_ASCLU
MQSDYSSICKSEVQPSSSDGDGAECRICRMPAHGLHFGLLTCGACAAFFRRSVACRLQYTCRLENGMCELNKTVQLNRDKIKNSSRTTLPAVAAVSVITSPPAESVTPRSEEQDCNVASVSYEKPNDKPTRATELPILPEFDYRQELPIIKETLKMEMPYYASIALSPIYLTGLQRIQLAYRACLAERPCPLRRPPSEDFPVQRFLVTDFAKQSRQDLKLVARFLTTIDSFRRLSFENKWLIFKRFWTNFLMCDRFYDTMCTLGNDMNDKRVVLPDGTVVDMQRGRAEELKEITDYSHEDLIRYVENNVFFVDTGLVETEFYVSLEAALASTKLEIAKEIRELSEREKKSLADELHLYYMSKCVSNYAWRLCMILHIVGSVQKAAAHKKEVITLAKVFDTYKYDVFMTELIE